MGPSLHSEPGTEPEFKPSQSALNHHIIFISLEKVLNFLNSRSETNAFLLDSMEIASVSSSNVLWLETIVCSEVPF